MPDRSVEHATMLIERTLDAPLRRAFAAWSDPALREAPVADSWDALEHEEFRVGGEKRMSFGPRSGPRYREEGRYEDIVPDRRIVYSYSILRGDVRITTSLQTIEFVARGPRTQMILTEQLAILDAGDKAADRERGIAAWLDRFAELLVGEALIPSER